MGRIALWSGRLWESKPTKSPRISSGHKTLSPKKESPKTSSANKTLSPKKKKKKLSERVKIVCPFCNITVSEIEYRKHLAKCALKTSKAPELWECQRCKKFRCDKRDWKIINAHTLSDCKVVKFSIIHAQNNKSEQVYKTNRRQKKSVLKTADGNLPQKKKDTTLYYRIGDVIDFHNKV